MALQKDPPEDIVMGKKCLVNIPPWGLLYGKVCDKMTENKGGAAPWNTITNICMNTTSHIITATVVRIPMSMRTRKR